MDGTSGPLHQEQQETNYPAERFPLWSDEPATQDLLAFRAVAETAADAIFDDGLDPVAIGLSGAWGSGKTSVLELIKFEITERSRDSERKVLVIPTQPWLYDPTVGPKESLIAEVLGALGKEFKETDPVGQVGLEAFKKLVRKVNWSKAVKMAARTAITMQLPNIDDVFGLVSDEPDSLDSEKGMAAFREEFAALLADPALAHLSRVVVLVDDLDRCLPDTVVETLEAIRLFLSAEGMSFVIAADEDRVSEAIQQKLKTAAPKNEDEDPAKLYLHKIVQTTIPLPALSRFDTEAYLFLLLSKAELGEDEAAYASFVAKCDELRIGGGGLDDLEIKDGTALAEHLVTATRLTPILYEKFHGNPRRIKRFLNDLNVRQSVARRRGFKLEADEVAKLMVLERILTEDFETVLGWLASSQLRDKLDALDVAANGRIEEAEDSTAETSEDEKPDEERSKKKAAIPVPDQEPARDDDFSDTIRRWAKLPPVLDASAISGYLYLAASFAKIEVIDTGLPERLRDLAVALTSSLKLDRAGVTDETLKLLPESDAQIVVAHLGRRTRDQPTLQKFTVESLLRLAAQQPTTQPNVVVALRGIPAADVEPATIIKLRPLDQTVYRPVLEAWRRGSDDQQLQQSVSIVETAWSSNGN
ncbi:Predicted P-loop ATPase, KAP-like [Brevibacterium aurantiacum]|uniref:Predicted P-loop ATPase, KAP-like n=1 Tax=Brevibacterium aurantiacum TaxID=273384 RepID=A0A2H1IRU7_BREAU|nr:P-loop NTPase fold protein [Brevibacterium aurantiacum]SMX77927.1 Predicted P-loop ATPase, KAP-like [Brevibacterium aurantiacum]